MADALRVNGSLTSLDVQYNNLGDEGKQALQDVARGKQGFKLLV